MKTKHALLALAIAFGTSFCACKKGENDPTLSLKSRTGRLKGEWKLTGGTITTTTGSNTIVETYNGSTLVTALNGTQISSVAYTDKIAFDKKGKYERSGVNDTVTFSEEGYWAWIHKNKEADLKKKEAIGMSSTKYTDSNGSVNTDAGFFVAGIWMLDELRTKKMVVIVDGSSTTGNVTTTKQGTYTYER